MTGCKERKMLVCPKCNIEYEEGKKFCRKCGSFLLSEEGSTFELPIVESTESEKTEKNLFCPRCQDFYGKGKYCRKCGSPLVQEIPSPEHETQRFEKKPLGRSQGKWLYFSHPSPLIAVSLLTLLLIVAGYFFWQSKEPNGQPMQPPSRSPDPVIETKEVEKIKSLFEAIRQANLKKNIDLFMSCYSLEFKDRERKRLDTLESWKKFNYLNLTYDLKTQRISVDTANVRVEWSMRISPKGTPKPEDNRTVLDVLLKREGDHWKIKEIQPTS